MMKVVAKIKTKRKIKPRKLLFYLSIVTVPLIQFCIFYVGVNFNSIVMAFQSYDFATNTFYWNNFENFKMAFAEFRDGPLLHALGNSVMYYGITIVTMCLSTFFSYYIFKKRKLSGLFRLVAFLPHIVSNITLVLIFKYFTESAYPAIYEMATGRETWGLLAKPDTKLPTVIIFCMFCGFGTQLMMISNAMSGIDQSVSEAARMDGVTPLREFFLVDLPMVFPTISTFVIVGVAGIFTNQISLFSFFGTNADPSTWTLGYYLYKEMKLADMSRYPYLACLGFLFTLVVVPITFLVKKVLNKLDPTA